MGVGVAGGDERLDERMGLVRLTEKVGVKLGADEKRVLLQFDHFDQLAVGGGAAEDEARLLERLAVGVVEFVAVAVAFVDNKRAVIMLGARSHGQLARL